MQQGLAGSALTLVNHIHIAEVAVGVFLNGLGVPGLGEVLLPLGGVAAREGRLNPVWLVAVAVAAQVTGSMLAYAIARYGGIALVERYGRYVLISHRDLQTAHRAVLKRGSWLVLVGAFVPGIQGFIGYVGGLTEMPWRRFLVAVVVGKLVWIGGLVALGMALGANVSLLDRGIRQLSVVVLLGLVAAIIWYAWRHHHSRPDEPASRVTAGKEH